jgi:hypothetical protein
MTSTTGDMRGATGQTAEAVRAMPDGWVLFAGTMILFTGFWNAFEGFLGLFRSSAFIGSPVFGSLWIWALAWLAFGILGIAAGGAILGGQSWGRWFGIAVASLNAFLHLLAVTTYPWWSLVIIAIDVLILFGLTVHWNRSPEAEY